MEDLTAVGFHVFTTGENNGRAPANMPSITFEIDPNMEGRTTNYSSLVFMPRQLDRQPVERLHRRDADRPVGPDGRTVPDHRQCNLNGSRCTFAEVMAFLNDGGDAATIMTAAVTKGRDYEWSGAVDGLRINDTVFDFEETGVFERAA